MTFCVLEGRQDKDCPITDIFVVSKQDYDSTAYPDYSIAEGPENLPWYLLFSRSRADKLPLVRFALTEEQPCLMDASVEKVMVNADIEIIPGRTRGTFSESCPKYFDEMFLSRSYRSAS